MAQQIKNTFLKSKMNKDLDDRILPNGEYRDARNISVGRSEDNDVGALENIIGNDLIRGTDIGNGLTIIGVHTNNATDQLFVFLTDYTDPSPINPTSAPASSLHYIYAYNNSTNSYTLLVEGEFLNFSTTNRIIGTNLIENLLFWTDNRNQPRKININLAGNSLTGKLENTIQNYYTSEHQISVAKYNPYQSIELYNRIDVQITTGASSYFQVEGDQVAKYTEFIGATVVSPENAINGESFIKVTSVTLNIATGDTRVFVSPNFSSNPTIGTYVTLIQSTMTNKNSESDWPGDPDYLEDKFVRFSYRFKYDDNEYSLMAPFTQIAYIPKQGGFFINGDEDSAYQSTIVDFMENSVQNIGLVIPLPTSGSRLLNDYKISELEILFRESDGVAVKVLESIAVQEVASAAAIEKYYTYDYQSRKPYKTLPEAQTVRVYDKVPVRAFSQESSGNRIIYGNYRDQHTPPANLNYNCLISDKFNSGTSNNWIEYPNHSVKRNRNYQVGFVLADKFGRQSPVILSSVDTGITVGSDFYSGSTIYSPYDLTEADTTVLDWFGDSIKVILNSQITSTINTSTGTPGLYALKQQEAVGGTGEGFAINSSAAIVNNTTYTFSLDDAAAGGFPNNINIPRINDYMRGAYEDFVKVTNITGPTGGGQIYTVTTDGRVNDVYLRTDNLSASVPDLKFAYTINDLGWYSYKIVVKQTEQEYYNVYLPGILNGYPGQSGYPSYEDPQGTINEGTEGAGKGVFPTNETNLTAFTALFNDNINKIPRDLKEVGDQDLQFRSSVVLYGRVTNIMTVDSSGPNFPDSIPFNAQYYARNSSGGKNAISHTSTAIATAKEVNMSFSDLSDQFNASGSSVGPNLGGYSGNLVFYQINTDPLIARISTTEKSIGATAASINSGGTYSNVNNPINTANMLPYLAVYETEPVESLLDIYWETSTSGLIVDLNTAVASGSGGATTFKDVNWDFNENDTPHTSSSNTYVTGDFYPINEEGDPYLIQTQAVIISQIDGAGNNVNLFSLHPGATALTFRLRFDGPSQVFREGSDELNVYTFVIRVTTSEGDTTDVTLGGIPGGEGAMKNATPSFSIDSSITKTPEDLELIPAVPLVADSTWTSIPENGSSIPGNGKRSQLVYTIEGRNTTVLPDNWFMDSSTGRLTQTTPSSVFPGNAAIVYECTLKVTDANAIGTIGTYGPLVFQRNLDISLGYPAVNAGSTSQTCVLTGREGGSNAIVATNTNEPKSRIFYIGGESITELQTIWDQNGLTGNVDAVRMNNGGTQEAHSKGTLAFIFNASQDANNASSAFKIDKVLFYYRIEGGDGNWLSLNRSLDYNNAGGNTETNAPSNDAPGPSGLTVTSLDDLNAIKYLQNVRAFDYNTLSSVGGQKIEYAILIKNLEIVTGSNDVYGWITADDLHYPACVTRQGTNIANTSYKYFRSIESNAFGEANAIDTNLELFAETPFGEYVNTFFTDVARTTPYLPNEATPYINFQLDQASYSSLKWRDISTGGDLTLIWNAGFNSETGNKKNNDPFVKAGQTTVYSETGNNVNLKLRTGTTRIKNNE